MRCIYCDHESTSVLDTRDSSDSVRRRRECKECGRRFTTYEKVETLDINVRKRDGEEQEFNEEKVREGVEKATKKTSITPEQVEEVVAEVKENIRGQKVIEASEIGEIVKERLKERDEVAYIRFASVYDSFDSAESFKEEIEALESTD